MKDKSCRSIGHAFNASVMNYGPPRQIISDNGCEFTGQAFKEVTSYYGSVISTIQAYHPSSNGLVESKNKLIVQILKCIVRDKPIS